MEKSQNRGLNNGNWPHCISITFSSYINYFFFDRINKSITNSIEHLQNFECIC